VKIFTGFSDYDLIHINQAAFLHVIGMYYVQVPCNLSQCAELKRLPVTLSPGHSPLSEVSILVSVHIFIQNNTLHRTVNKTICKEWVGYDGCQCCHLQWYPYTAGQDTSGGEDLVYGKRILGESLNLTLHFP
jgi:hypothetical protein